MLNLDDSIFVTDFIDEACTSGYVVTGEAKIQIIDFT
jgi:hypothetical protein